MKKDKILIILFVVLAIAIAILFFMGKAKAATTLTVAPQKFPLVPGSTGKAVMMVQAYTNVPITGTWDDATTKAADSQLNTDSLLQADWVDLFSGHDDTASFPIQLNSTGFYVKYTQILLGTTITGFFDAATQTALKNATGLTSLSQTDYRNLITKALGI